MAGVLDSVNQRTRLVGHNRLELLLFSVGGSQLYGINVFKVKEVLQCPPLTEIPRRHAFVKGVAHVRDGTIAVVDLSRAIGGKPLTDVANCFVIITEYNRTSQGFLVAAVDRIVNLNWADIHPPPEGIGGATYLTAVTEVDDQLVEIIDVEKILAEVAPQPDRVSEGFTGEPQNEADYHVLVVDDSMIARKQIQNVMQSLGIKTTSVINGREALNLLEETIAAGRDPCAEFLLIISDIEMPEMDGYTFTANLRVNPALQSMYVILHTSLSGVFNEAMVKKAGADDFLAKFSADELAARVCGRISQLTSDSGG